jgi:hypothetical protein
LDPVLQPGFYAYSSLAALLAVVWHGLSPRVRLPGKAMLAMAIVVVPHSGEVYLTPTNLQWVLALALLALACKDDARTALDWAVDGGVLLLAGLSGPFVVLLIPVFLVRAVLRKTPSSWLLLGGAAVVAGVQARQMLGDRQPPELSGPFQPGNLAAVVAFRWPVNLFLGSLWTASLGAGPTIATGVIIVAVVGALAWRHAPARATAPLLVLALAALLAASERRIRFDLWLWSDLSDGDRYFFVPKVVLLWLAIVAMAGAGRVWLKWALGALVALSVAAGIPRFRFPPRMPMDAGTPHAGRSALARPSR